MSKRDKFDYSVSNIASIVHESFSFTEVLRKLGSKSYGGGSTHKIQHIIVSNSINTNHFRKNRSKYRKLTDDLLFSRHVIEIGFKSGTVHIKAKKRMLELGVPYQCFICKIDNWQNNPITLQLEHKDGDRYNFTYNNLCLLCPNCHSQTPTYGGGNQKRKEIVNNATA